MKRTAVRDEFFDKQPPLEFIEGLKAPVHTAPPALFSRTEPEEGEISVKGLYLKNEFPDPKGLLETVVDDFTLFSRLAGILGDRYPITLKQGITPCFEAYTVEVTEEGCTVTAADTEGIRRGLLSLEDRLVAAEGPLLKLGRIERKPWLKSRITRGYFSPTNRPPKNGDELLDDIDYYPDEYLNRLMHDGTNGLWIYTSFHQLLPSSIVEENGEDYEKRIAKLNRVIESCARYGVKVYAFVIEPYQLKDEAAVKKYADMIGIEGWNTICPLSETAQKYCYEQGKLLFTLCPDLAGLIDITAGERTTSCASVANRKCPRCGHLSRGEILDRNVENLRAGIRAVKPEAEFVSWTYGHRVWEDRDIIDYVKGAPDDVMLMQNFDDRGFEKQLGKERVAMDYWLSYVGPSELFRVTAKATKKYNKHLWAKMQICSSHEIATLPYVPSPGHVFGKMAAANRLGVEGLMECWYFGNYPCFMSKAASDLAFCHDFSDEDAYLEELAAATYGRSVAKTVVKAWKFFEKGYTLYPINIMFSYYSPMHDGVVWELSLKPKNYSPSRSWLLLDKPDGDRINDSLLTGHTLEEAITLLTSMHRYYKQGMAELGILSAQAGPKLKDLLSVSGAFLLLCRSALNILNFYKLRDVLGTGEGEPRATLEKMRQLVLDEIETSTQMSLLCLADNRLGYHSEAEGFKFFPEKMAHRIETLRTLLATEFKEVAERIEAGLPPLAYYLGEEEDIEHSYLIETSDPDQATWTAVGDENHYFRLAADDTYLIFDIRGTDYTPFLIAPEFRLTVPNAAVYAHFGDGKRLKPRLAPTWSEHWSLLRARHDAELAKWQIKHLPDEDGYHRARIKIKRTDAGLRGTAPFKLRVHCVTDWENEPVPVVTLGKYYLSPGCFGWIRFKDGVAYNR